MKCLLLLALLVSAHGELSENLFLNPGFEDPLDGSNWFCSKCSMATSEQSFSGKYAVKVFDRTDKAEGVKQTLTTIRPSTLYHVTAQIYMLNQVNFWHMCRITVVIRGAVTDRVQISTQTQMRPTDGWIMIGGDFETKPDTTSITVIFFMAEYQELEYLLDDASIKEIPRDPNWRENAEERIDLLRKGNLRINTQIGGEYRPEDVSIWINQTKSSFPFGCTALRPYLTGTDAQSKKYQEYFYDMFNWATPTNDMKWLFMEETEDVVEYWKPDDIVAVLHANNITNIRGHCVAWNKEEYLPTWLIQKTPQDIKAAVQRRIEYVIPKYRGVVRHWDVNNEIIQGGWLEEKTGNTEFSQGMFHEVKKLDPDVKLFLNDHGVLTNGLYYSAYRRHGALFKANGVPVDAMGVQSHLPGWDIDVIKHRLDVVATAGVPIWITEFELGDADLSRRAEGIDSVLTLYFSLPYIDGIILWGFWDQTHDLGELKASLLDGADLVENEAGVALRNLVKNKWRSHFEYKHGTDAFATKNFRVFHGDYEVTIRHLDKEIYKIVTSVEKDKDVEINLSLTNEIVVT